MGLIRTFDGQTNVFLGSVGLGATPNERLTVNGSISANNTIFGTQIKEFPSINGVLVCDMSSDIFSRKIDVSKFDLIFANILFLPLKKMVKSANKYLFKNGLLILSGISIKQSIRIEKIYVGHNFKKIASLTDENWMTLVMKKF